MKADDEKDGRDGERPEKYPFVTDHISELSSRHARERSRESGGEKRHAAHRDAAAARDEKRRQEYLDRLENGVTHACY